MKRPSPADERKELERLAAFAYARQSLAGFCKLTDPTFADPSHIRKIIEHLEALERRDIEALLIALPVRHGKSYMTSQRFPAWFLGRNPKKSFVLASYGAELAEEHSRRARALIRLDDWPFDTRLSDETAAMNRWGTTDGGGMIAVGIGGALTGRGADVLDIDDPLKDREDAESPTNRERVWNWYTDVAKTRLMPGGVQLITATRWHDDDLSGRILNSRQAKRWTTLILPRLAEENDPLGRAPGEDLWPERQIPLPSVEDGEISSRSFAAIYQQRPVPAEGNLFKAAWMERRYTSLPPDAKIIQAIDGSWKTGAGNDYSVIATWAHTRTDFYLVDVWRKRVEFPELKAACKAQYQRYNPAEIIVEDAASGIALIQSLKIETRLPIIPIKARGAKEVRAEAVTPLFESGRVLLPENAPWLDVWLDEHLRFPAAPHDDTVDTTSLALSRLQRPRGVYFAVLGQFDEIQRAMLADRERDEVVQLL